MGGKIYISDALLPNAYQQVEYLETDGNAYILTTHQPGAATRTVAEFSNVTGGTTQTTLFGAASNSGDSWFQWAGDEYSCFAVKQGNGFSTFNSSTNPNGGKFKVDKKPGQCTVYYGNNYSNSQTVNTNDSSSFNKTDNYGVIFGINGPDGLWDGIQNGVRLYSYKTYNTDTIARNYIPCYRKSDNEPGLYDLINSIFYTNSSSVEGSHFTCGSNVYIGTARKVENVYAGISGVAKKISKVYAGVNNIAKQVYPNRVYLFSGANGDNTALTGGWDTVAFYHQTNSGTNYSMTRMSPTIWQGIHLLSGSYSSSDGTSEKAMFAKTNNAINFAPYQKLHVELDRRTTKDTSPTASYFGVFNSQGSYFSVTCKTNELTTKFLAYATHPNNVNSAYEHLAYDINISHITGSYIFVYDNYHSNMNANISINITDIWLE